MERGYVKLWRKIEDSAVFDDAHLYHLFSWLLIKANRRPRQIASGETIPAGSLTISVRDLAERFHCGKSTIARRLEKLEFLGMVTVVAGHRYSVISICNWDTYQSGEQEWRDASGTQAGHKRDTSGTQAGHLTRNRELEKLRNGEGAARPAKLTKTKTRVSSPVAENSSLPHSPAAPNSAPPDDSRAKRPAPSSDRAEEISLPLELDQPAFCAAWSDWISYRRERRLTLRARTLRAQLDSLIPLGPDAATECIRISIRNGWQGIFPDKVNRNGKQRTIETGPGQTHGGKPVFDW